MEANLATSAGFSDETVGPTPPDLDGPRGGDGGGGGGGCGGTEEEATEAYLLHWGRRAWIGEWLGLGIRALPWSGEAEERRARRSIVRGYRTPAR